MSEENVLDLHQVQFSDPVMTEKLGTSVSGGECTQHTVYQSFLLTVIG